MNGMHAMWMVVLISLLALTAGAGQLSVDRVEGSLALQAAVGRRAFAMGEPVELLLTARNAGNAAVSVTFMSGQRYDFIVRRARGDEVWRWSHDKAFIQVIQAAALRPQEALTFRESWDQRDLQGRRVDPGSYEVIAVFMGRLEAGRGGIALPPIGFTVTK